MPPTRLLLFAEQPAVDVSDANLPDDGLWASISFDGRQRRVRRPTGPLQMRDVATGEPVTIAPELVDDLPPTDDTIVFRASFDESGRLVGRLVPERTTNNNAGTHGVAAYAPRNDAAALYLARYMPWSRAVLIFMDRFHAVDAIIDGLHAMGPVLLVYGCIDIQGVQQLMADSLVDSAHAPDDPARVVSAKYIGQSYEWWHELLQNVDQIQAACVQHNRHELSASSTNTMSTLQVLHDLGLFNDFHTRQFWTHKAASVHTVIANFYVANGRVGGPTANFVEAMHAFDMLYWHDASGEAVQMLRRSRLAGWFEPSVALGQLAAGARTIMTNLPLNAPIVVINHAEQWNDYALSYAMAALIWASPPPSVTGQFAATGSHVPIKFVMLCDSAETRHPVLSPQFSSA